jgi:Icc protein
MEIAHISDLHVSGSYFVPEWGDKIVKKINSLNPEILIISGDLTDDGHLFEYEKAAKFIKRFDVIYCSR